MNYDLNPIVSRLTLFNGDGNGIAGVDVNFGPIMIRARLVQGPNGMFLSWPSRKSEQSDKYFDYVAIADPNLRMKAQEAAVKQYKILSQGELVAV